MTGLNGVNAYQQTAQAWNQESKKIKEADQSASTNKTKSKIDSKADSNVKINEWKPISTTSPLVPQNIKGIGMAIGEVNLSDGAKDYYDKLKAKFGNMQFIAVSTDMKDQVKKNAAAYGNANKMVVLIDDAKLEQMATDENFRKKYEGIIAMSQTQLESAKNSLISSGANVKNFGMSVNADGTTSLFATLEKSSADQAKIVEKKQAEKRAAKVKEKKVAEKKAFEKRLEKAKEDKKAAEAELEDGEDAEAVDEKEYVTLEASSLEELLNKVSAYAYNNSANSVMTEAEKSVGQNFDFKG